MKSTLKSGQQLRKQMLDSTRDAAMDVGEDWHTRSVHEAPVKTGRLRDSIKWHAQVDDNGIEIEVTANTPYAAKQHQELSYNHPKGGKAMYIRDPMLSNFRRYLQHIADGVRKGWN